MFTIRIHHSVSFRRFPGRQYVGDKEDIFDLVDIDVFYVHELDPMATIEEFEEDMASKPTTSASKEYSSNEILLLKWHDSSAPSTDSKISWYPINIIALTLKGLQNSCREDTKSDWKLENKSLSFAGRLQLIMFILSSMYLYWASIFILPSRIMEDLERKMRGRKAYLLEDKQIPSVGVFSTWMAFGGNTRDLGSFGEETDKITDLHQFHKEVLLIERRDGVAGIKRRRRDLSSDGVRYLVTASDI
ncbi:hypothetical protein Tco_1568525 [Tanacetum coccineum]